MRYHWKLSLKRQFQISTFKLKLSLKRQFSNSPQPLSYIYIYIKKFITIVRYHWKLSLKSKEGNIVICRQYIVYRYRWNFGRNPQNRLYLAICGQFFPIYHMVKALQCLKKGPSFVAEGIWTSNQKVWGSTYLPSRQTYPWYIIYTKHIYS